MTIAELIKELAVLGEKYGSDYESVYILPEDAPVQKIEGAEYDSESNTVFIRVSEA